MIHDSAHIRTMVLIAACLTVSLLAQSQTSQTSSVPTVPAMVKFSGTVAGAPGGVVGLTFALYKDQTGGAPLWLETQSVAVDATGHYNVQLGATLAHGLPKELFASGEARWLGVQREGQAEQPRVLLLSVPYALKAADAETLGGLPASAFALAAPANAALPNSAAPAAGANSAPPPNAAVTGLGTVNFLPLWDGSSDIVSSAISQTGSGTTAKIGINTTAPTVTLDVKGASTIRGPLTMPTTGTATTTTGKNSQPLNLSGSAFNSGTATTVNQTFRLQTEPVGNNSAAPSGKLNLLYYSGANAATETGLSIASNGRITFADGQTFPGTGTGTITGVTAGPGLTGGGTGGDITVALTGSCGLGQFLQWNSVTWICTNVITNVAAGTDLTGSVTNGTATLNLDVTKVPRLNAPNTFTGFQTINGNLSATGIVAGSSFQIDNQLFGYGSYATRSAFLGFGGSTTNTGLQNTAVGADAFHVNTTGQGNTAIGYFSMPANSTGYDNTAVGDAAMNLNTTGYNNTASGNVALQNNTTGAYNSGYGLDALALNATGNFNTAIGYLSGPDSAHTALNNSTAVGAFATVTASNSLVLGSISGVNGAGSNTNVGIGTTAPAFALDVHGTGNFTGPVTFASSQAFPNTVSGVTAGTGLTGGGTTGNVTLNLDTTAVPLLNAANQFKGNQNINGNLNAVDIETYGTLYSGHALFNGTNGNGVLQVSQVGGALGAIGIYSSSTASSGVGVFGLANDSNGVGVEGLNNSPTGGFGVLGAVNNTSGVGIGVWGKTYGGSSIGVEGDASSATTIGVVGTNTTGGLAGEFFGAVQVNGNFAGTGTVTGTTVNATSAFNLGSALFATGSTSSANAFLGFAGNAASTGVGDAASGPFALQDVTTGSNNSASGAYALQWTTIGNSNTASGNSALGFNTAGSENTASGASALRLNTTGTDNTGLGYSAGRLGDASSLTGSNNTLLGANTRMKTGSLTNATAIGALAEVDESNALILGSFNNGVNGSPDTSVGIGTAAPAYKLHVVGNDATGTGVQIAANNSSTTGSSFAVFNASSNAGVTAELTADGLGTGPLGTPSGYFGTFSNHPIGFITANVERMVINTSGFVGVGVAAPTHIFQVGQGKGAAFADGWSTYSSRRWKTNIQTLPDALAKVEQLRGVSYDLKGSSKHEIGVIAEEVGQVVPEVVSFEANGKDAQGVDYSRLTAVLIEAVKQQQREIADQQRQISRLNGKVEVLESALRTTRQTKTNTESPDGTSAASGGGN